MAHPAISRRALSLAVCEAWQWRQPNGTPCDAICRGLLLWLHRAGHLTLPPPRWTARKPWRPRTNPPPVLIDTSPIDDGACGTCGPSRFTRSAARRDEPPLQQPARAAPLSRLPATGRRAPQVSRRRRRPPGGVLRVGVGARGTGLRDRFIGWSRRGAAPPSAAPRGQHPLSDPAVGAGAASGLAPARAAWRAALGRLGTPLQPSDLLARDLHRSGAVSRHLLPRRELDRARARRRGRGHRAPTKRPTRPVKDVLGYPLMRRLPRAPRRRLRWRRRSPRSICAWTTSTASWTGPGMPRSAPTSYATLKAAIRYPRLCGAAARGQEHQLAGLRYLLFGTAPRRPATCWRGRASPRPRRHPQAERPPPVRRRPARGRHPRGHGRHAADAYRRRRARRRPACPRAPRRSVSALRQRESLRAARARLLVRLVGQPPIAATVYQLEKLRCNLCGELFTADPPPGVGPEKYDATTGAHDRALEVRQRDAVPPARTACRPICRFRCRHRPNGRSSPTSPRGSSRS